MKIACVLIGVLLVGAGCQKQSSDAPPAPPAPVSAPAKTSSAPTEGEATAQDSTAKTTARLTQALRKYSAEHQRVPKSLDELVAEGYLTELPTAPPGKIFSFDDKLQVKVVDKK